MIGNQVGDQTDTEVFQSPSAQRHFGTLVIGGGPAGVALLLAARRSNRLKALFSSGIRILEKSAHIGIGAIGNYVIRSDSMADSFLAAVDFDAFPSLRHTLSTPTGKKLDALRGSPAELTLISEFLYLMSQELRSALQIAEYDPFELNVEAVRAQRQSNGSWLTECRNFDGKPIWYESSSLVLTTGAEQRKKMLTNEKVAGLPLLPRFQHKTMLSSAFLGQDGPHEMAKLLKDKTSPKVAIIGGSHSAISSANLCLRGYGNINFAIDCVTVLHANELRLTYASPDAAVADGYTFFESNDICPNTGRVFPLAGFRADSRELLRRVWGLGGEPVEARLHLFKLNTDRFKEANRILVEADVIIAAMGYSPRALPLFNESGRKIRLNADNKGSLVDNHSRVLDELYRPIPGVYAMGLAAGYPLAGVHGEPSFTGQANGIALWQSAIGEHLISLLLENPNIQSNGEPAYGLG